MSESPGQLPQCLIKSDMLACSPRLEKQVERVAKRERERGESERECNSAFAFTLTKALGDALSFVLIQLKSSCSFYSFAPCKQMARAKRVCSIQLVNWFSFAAEKPFLY